VFTIRIEGGAQLAADLNRLSERVRRSILLEALEEAAEPIRALASRYAPHEPGPPDIRANIITAKTSKTISAGGFLAKQDEFQATVAIGPSKGFAYGLPQEYGTIHHAAQPFMRPAFDQGAPKTLDMVGRSIWLALVGRQMFRPGSLK
jgi:HK97 gp10 family phage protein